MSEVRVAAVDAHIDLMCPYAFQTSKWLREVRDRCGVDVRWKFFSLEEVNRAEGKKHPWEREWSYGWSMMRVGAALRRMDADLLDRWYLLAGSSLHEQGLKPHRIEVARELVGRLGVDESLVDDAIADPTTHDEVMAEHQRVRDAGGWGVPTLFFPDGQCLFGPVVIDPPTGAEAERLWQHVLGWLEFPRLYEIQRPKNAEAIAHIAEVFSPYLDARDWVTIQHPTP